MKLLSSLFLLVMLAAHPAQPQIADVVVLNGKVWTVDASKPEAQAVAVLNGRILAVGSTAEIRRHVGKGTTQIDLSGKRLLPGFIDNHTHFMNGGFQSANVDLRAAVCEEEFARLIKERAEAHPGRWITGGDWDHDRWLGGKLPAKELIDRYTPTTPVFVNRYDGHMALANSFVLKLAGITKDTPEPPGGAIVKDPITGEPTGVLKDEAMSFVWKLLPEPSEEELLEAGNRGLYLTNAYAAFEETEKGSITPGRLADFVVLSDDIHAIEPVRIQNVEVEMTILGGSVVYERRPRK